MGELDDHWTSKTRRVEQTLFDLGIPVDGGYIRDDSAPLRRLTGDMIYNVLDGYRGAQARGDPEVQAVSSALDAFHQAAATADEEVYFGLIAPTGVFLGTDAAERWTKAQFEAWARDYFQRDSAWVYTMKSRNITVSPDGRIAWFDEIVNNARLGDCRGSGVLVKHDGRWLIEQYNLAMLIPNDLAIKFADEVRAYERAGGN